VEQRPGAGRLAGLPLVRGPQTLADAQRALGLGALSGERNGNYRHGFYTAEAIAERKATRSCLLVDPMNLALPTASYFQWNVIVGILG
jgi:hypothetical protein